MDDFRFEDLRVQINPQSGADGNVSVVDRDAVLADVSVTADKGGISLTEAGRPQPPSAEFFAINMRLHTCI